MHIVVVYITYIFHLSFAIVVEEDGPLLVFFFNLQRRKLRLRNKLTEPRVNSQLVAGDPGYGTANLITR